MTEARRQPRRVHHGGPEDESCDQSSAHSRIACALRSAPDHARRAASLVGAAFASALAQRRCQLRGAVDGDDCDGESARAPRLTDGCADPLASWQELKSLVCRAADGMLHESGRRSRARATRASRAPSPVLPPPPPGDVQKRLRFSIRDGNGSRTRIGRMLQHLASWRRTSRSRARYSSGRRPSICSPASRWINSRARAGRFRRDGTICSMTRGVRDVVLPAGRSIGRALMANQYLLLAAFQVPDIPTDESREARTEPDHVCADVMAVCVAFRWASELYRITDNSLTL